MTTPAPDTVVGHHILEEKLGEGGFGEVWRARRHPDAPPPEHPDEPEVVAVKIARDPARARTLSNEAALLKKLHHPSIVRVFGIRASEDPPHFIMEMVAGHDLAKVLDQRDDRRLSWRTALPMAAQIADALSAAHGQGVVHGDIKPHNVLIREEGDVVLTDFGLGQAGASKGPAPLASSIELSQEAAQSIAGTLAYMAPECKRGIRANEASDIYSLGAMVFEMLVGHTPRGAWRSLERRGVESPPRLDSLLRSMLDPMPPRRPANAAAVAARLAELSQASTTGPLVDTALRRCPEDSAPLHTSNVGPVILDRCRRCDGTWFDTGEIEEVLRQLTGSAYATNTDAAPRSSARRPCPICNDPLAPSTLRLTHSLEDDSEVIGMIFPLRCPHHGLWLEAKERQALLDAARQSLERPMVPANSSAQASPTVTAFEEWWDSLLAANSSAQASPALPFPLHSLRSLNAACQKLQGLDLNRTSDGISRIAYWRPPSRALGRWREKWGCVSFSLLLASSYWINTLLTTSQAIILTSLVSVAVVTLALGIQPSRTSLKISPFDRSIGFLHSGIWDLDELNRIILRAVPHPWFPKLVLRYEIELLMRFGECEWTETITISGSRAENWSKSAKPVSLHGHNPHVFEFFEALADLAGPQVIALDRIRQNWVSRRSSKPGEPPDSKD